MNFLAHFYIADKNNDSFVGQFLGDFVKGRRIDAYGADIQDSIRFHRKIDSFSDTHPAMRSSRQRITPGFRRYAGIIVDVSYDHYLARHWHRYSDESLRSFTQRVYDELKQGRDLLAGLPELVLSRMIDYDWLGSYRYLEHVGTALDRIATRLTRGESFMGSITEVEANYDDLENDFFTFFPDMIASADRLKKGCKGNTRG